MALTAHLVTRLFAGDSLHFKHIDTAPAFRRRFAVQALMGRSPFSFIGAELGVDLTGN